MGFSAEMKDFLTAYKTGQAINASRTNQEYLEKRGKAVEEKAARDNDPEMIQLAKDKARATLAATKQRMSLGSAASGRAAALLSDRLKTSDLNRQLTQERINQIRGLGEPVSSGLLPSGGIAPSTTGAGVLPVAPSTLDDGTDMYAEGGLVEEDDGLDDGGVLDTSLDDEQPTQMAALTPPPAPSFAPQQTAGAIPTSPVAVPATPAASRNRGIDGIIAPALVEDARRNGMKFAIEKSGLHQSGAVRSPAAQMKAKQIAAGMGGLSEQEMQAAREAVDPEHKLTDSQRNVAALGSVYQFWANKGEPEKAQRVAFQMLQYYRNASQRYAALAAKAAEGGNMDLATKAALKAYANVPDGKDLELSINPDGGLLYSYTDEKGDVIDRGIATPQQLVSSAMGLASGGFDRALLSAAGAVPDDTLKGKGGGKTQTASDRAKETESIGGEVEKLKGVWAEKNKGEEIDENRWADIGNVAQHIYQQNKGSTPNEAVQAAGVMLSMGDDPEKPGFKVKPGEDGAPSTIEMPGGRRIQLDDQQLENILSIRAARVKAAVDGINRKMEEEDKPGFLDTVGRAAKNIGGIIVDELTPPEPIRRAAVHTGGRIMDAVGAIPDGKVNMGTITTGVKNAARGAIEGLKEFGKVGKHDPDELKE